MVKKEKEKKDTCQEPASNHASPDMGTRALLYTNNNIALAAVPIPGILSN